jgi:hypothetical protein
MADDQRGGQGVMSGGGLEASWMNAPTAPPQPPPDRRFDSLLPPQPPSRRGARPVNRAPAERGPVELGLNVATARRLLWAAMVAIVVLDFVGSIGAALGAPYTITRFLDGDYKVNFPTGYKTTFLLATTLLFALLWRAARRDGDRFAPGWLLLSLVAAFAWVDETVYLHQSISEVLHDSLHTTGPLKFAWTIVYFPAAVAVFVILLRYLKYLVPSVRRPLLLGGVLYGGGAVLFEPIKSHFSDTAGENSLPFKAIAWASDSSEMVGLTLLVVVLLTELARRAGAVAVLFSSGSETGVPQVPGAAPDMPGAVPDRPGAAQAAGFPAGPVTGAPDAPGPGGPAHR